MNTTPRSKQVPAAGTVDRAAGEGVDLGIQSGKAGDWSSFREGEGKR
jgi:hypothetical protein